MFVTVADCFEVALQAAELEKAGPGGAGFKDAWQIWIGTAGRDSLGFSSH